MGIIRGSAPPTPTPVRFPPNQTTVSINVIATLQNTVADARFGIVESSVVTFSDGTTTRELLNRPVSTNGTAISLTENYALVPGTPRPNVFHVQCTVSDKNSSDSVTSIATVAVLSARAAAAAKKKRTAKKTGAKKASTRKAAAKKATTRKVATTKTATKKTRARVTARKQGAKRRKVTRAGRKSTKQPRKR